MNLESYGANATSGLVCENDEFGHFTACCTSGEWAAGQLRHSGRLVSIDLALRPVGVRNAWVCHGLEETPTRVIMSWPIIPTIRVGWLKLDRAESIAYRVRGPPDENGGFVGCSYDRGLSDIEDPAEGASLLFIVVDPSSGISCTVHGTILDDPPT